ncbi:MAG: DUF2382 domain-containing protein [Acidobacteria bacterium]|nr:DUF2382 domain-containing protein [Acidobacteriota bacterium]
MREANSTDAQYVRMGETSEFQVSSEDPDVTGWTVVEGTGSRIGEVRDLIVDTSTMKVSFLEVELHRSGEDGRLVRVPIEQVDLVESERRVVVENMASAYAAATSGVVHDDDRAADRMSGALSGHDTEDARITRSEEEVRVGTRTVEAGEVVVGKHVETEHVSTPVSRRIERVRIERRPVSGEAAAASSITEREIRIPIAEEEVVVEKRPVVKEEIVITKESDVVTDTVETDLRKERIHVSGDEDLIDDEAGDGASTRLRSDRGGPRG